MAQPHRPAPITPTPTGLHSTSAGVTEGLPTSVTATNPQYTPGAGGYPPPGGGLPPSPGMGRRRWLILATCAVLGSAVGVAGDRLARSSPTSPAVATPTPSATASVTARIDPIAAKDSSFKPEGSNGWRSETYNDAKFGNLKKGIGLRFDLGSARPLTAITFTAQTGPMTVELRAGDTESSDGADYRLVGTPVDANGPTTLNASAGGSHRYWVIWVTELPPGFKARITDPTAKG